MHTAIKPLPLHIWHVAPGCRQSTADLVAAEATMLEALDFDLGAPSHPQLHITRLAHALGPQFPAGCLRVAFAMANDCFRFDLVLHHSPLELAAACVYAAAAAHQLPARRWLEQLDASLVPGAERATAALCAAYSQCARLDAAAFKPCETRVPCRSAAATKRPAPAPAVGSKRKVC